MKKLLLILSAFASFALYSVHAAQPEIAGPGDHSLQYVTKVDGADKSIIYDATQVWLAENFASSKAVISYANKEQGVIIGEGVLCGIVLKSGFSSVDENLAFKIKIEVKDGRFRLTFSNFRIENRVDNSLFKTEADQAKARLANVGEQIAKSLQGAGQMDF